MSFLMNSQFVDYYYILENVTSPSSTTIMESAVETTLTTLTVQMPIESTIKTTLTTSTVQMPTEGNEIQNSLNDQDKFITYHLVEK